MEITWKTGVENGLLCTIMHTQKKAAVSEDGIPLGQGQITWEKSLRDRNSKKQALLSHRVKLKGV